MRPTKVRARVGSSLSGSADSATRSVPPFFAGRVSPLAVGAGVLELMDPQAAPARARATASGRMVARRVSVDGIVGLPVRSRKPNVSCIQDTGQRRPITYLHTSTPLGATCG